MVVYRFLGVTGALRGVYVCGVRRVVEIVYGVYCYVVRVFHRNLGVYRNVFELLYRCPSFLYGGYGSLSNLTDAYYLGKYVRYGRVDLSNGHGSEVDGRTSLFRGLYLFGYLLRPSPSFSRRHLGFLSVLRHYFLHLYYPLVGFFYFHDPVLYACHGLFHYAVGLLDRAISLFYQYNDFFDAYDGLLNYHERVLGFPVRV